MFQFNLLEEYSKENEKGWMDGDRNFKELFKKVKVEFDKKYEEILKLLSDKQKKFEELKKRKERFDKKEEHKKI